MFIRFHGLKHPAEMGAVEVEAFLRYLATERKSSASTHRVALSALLYLYKQVLDVDLPWMEQIGRPQRQQRLPVVLAPEEVCSILDNLDGAHGLLAQLLYGTGMRLTEGLRLRVKDIDFDRLTIIVREGNGGKDRAVMPPQSLVVPLREQLSHSKALWALGRSPQRK